MLLKRKSKTLLLTSIILSMTVFMSSCSGISYVLEKFDQDREGKIRKIIKEQADDYDIDAKDVEVSQGGDYFTVLIDTISSYEDLQDVIIFKRKWLRFANDNLDGQYFVGFFDRTCPDIWYGGFSNQDLGYDSEYYWDDYDVIMGIVSRIESTASGIDKHTDVTPEKFYEVTGIDEDTADEMRHRMHEDYPSFKDVVPDKSVHYYCFIPGDTIMHREKFTVGDDECPIEPGTYYVDLPNSYGVIHITDKRDKTKYRLDARHRYGHTDELYDYEILPALVEIEKGDIIYMKNCTATFDLADD